MASPQQPGAQPNPFGLTKPVPQYQSTPPMGTFGVPDKPAPQSNVQDEYQRLFGGGGHAGTAPPAPNSAQPAVFGGATQSFQAPQMPVHAAPPPAAGPSEFTRMFSAPQVPMEQPPSVPAAQPTPPAPKPAAPKWPIFLFAGVFLIIIVAVVVLLMRS